MHTVSYHANGIKDKEIELVHDLATKVLNYESALTLASDACAEVDAMAALAQGAEKYHWSAPKMTENNFINIRDGRHPLQELTVPSFVPNNCVIAGGCDVDDDASESGVEHDFGSTSTLIITGPNHSGKSVYLKQVALIVYLAHIGSFVPAGSATIGLTDKILTRISTRESVSRNESAFAIDLRQTAFALKFATRRSLVIVDEFGKGTRPDDGAGLMTAFLDHFQSLGTQRPKVLATTHFHEIFENGCLDEGNGVSFAQMEGEMSRNQSNSDDQVTYLYRLTAGRSMSSFGSQCAQTNGVDSAVVERSKAIAKRLSNNENLREVCAKLTPEEEARLKVSEDVARRFLNIPDREFELAIRGTAEGAGSGGRWRRVVQKVISGDIVD